jgi:hypothetical protein
MKDSVATIVERFVDSYAYWNHLENKFKPKGGSRRLMLLWRLVYSRKEEGFSME